MMKTALLTSLFLVFACSGDDEMSNDYSNRVILQCGDGDPLLDRTFTSLEECETFADDNSFECNDVPLTIDC